ncbi:hypothetical protein CCB80_01390 [Armatimonadetes bacterium Uphvl-Ar1]|nr:hypothetical protein CCB80_01390 [Armatimonadetes bacterium Uphvl-Ar1]
MFLEKFCVGTDGADVVEVALQWLGTRMNSDCPVFRSVVSELDELAPGVPLLALGQTVFWDEPMKAGVFRAFSCLGNDRKFVAGVHDTDYFAKFQMKGAGGFAALPHNDTTTKDLWSAAGEFSHIFGSETVVSKEKLTGAGAKVGLIEHVRPQMLDSVTEAYGWKGVVSLSAESKITAEKGLSRLFPHIYDTFSWALDESLSLISGDHHRESMVMRDRLLAMVCEARDQACDDNLACFYEGLLPKFYDVVAGGGVELETTRTTRLLKFNRETAGRKRFEIVDLFLNPVTRELARESYDDSVRGSEIYTLDRFGSCALPFDLVIPGVGRGTLRLGKRGGVVMTDIPVGFSFKRPIETVEQLAEVIEAKFGPNCVLVGKAVSLILMLGTEYVFVFHEGASGYVWRSAKMARLLAESGHDLGWHPILRVKLNPWDAMDDCCAWLQLPEDMRRPFGTSELSAPTFALRWREVVDGQKQVLRDLGDVRRPLALLGYLQSKLGGQWERLAGEYQAIAGDFSRLGNQIGEVKYRKRGVLSQLKSAKAERNELEHAKGRHWREFLFDKDAGDVEQKKREEFGAKITAVDRRIQDLKIVFRSLEDEQRSLVDSPVVRRIRDKRFNIALEAELMRVKLIREAVVSGEGLAKAGYRPSAWWFPLVCPDGTWFRSTMMKTECRLEPLVVRSEVEAS